MLVNKLVCSILFCLLLLGCQDNDNKQNVVVNKSVTEQLIINDKIAQAAMIDPLIALSLIDISEREAGKNNAIEFIFNIPLQADQNFERFIETTPKLATPVLSKNGKKLQFFGIQPETDYMFNIIAGLKAQNGKTLLQQVSHSLTTRSMQAVVSFKVKAGAILVPGHSDDLGIYSVNVAEADLNIYRVKADKLTDFISNFSYIANSGAYHYQNARRQALIEHIYTARIETGAEANQRHITKFPITDKNWANETGVYFATLGKPGDLEFTAATWFSVSAIGLQIRQFPKQTYVITQDIKTGKLLTGVQVDFLDNNSKRYASLTSDQQGTVMINNNERLSLIVARDGEQVTVLPYRNPRFDLSDFNVGSRPYSDSQIFVYSERDIYRPGESLILNMLQRDADGQVQDSPLSVSIFKPDGSAYKSVWLKATDKKNGYYQYHFDLPKSGPVGNWQAKVNAKGNSKYTARFHFKVEDFLPERLRLTLGETGVLNSFSPKQKLMVKVLGEYLYGAPAAGNQLETRATISAWTQPFKQWPDYYVGDIDGARQDSFELPEVKLNDAGEYITKVDQGWTDWAVPIKVRLNYSLFESGGRAINRHHDSLLWPKASFIAVKPSFKNGQSDNDSKIDFSLLKLDKNGTSLTTGEVKAALIREEKRYFWTYSNNNGWHYERIEKEYVVDNRILTFVDQDPIKLSEIVEWGDYRLELTDLSTQAKTTYRFRAGESWYNDWENNSSTIRPDRINLALDKASYLSGETLSLRIGSPTAGTALVSIESDQVLYQQQVEVVKGESTVSLTVPKSTTNRHDLYISVFVISPSDSDAKSVTNRSFGIIHLPLNRENRQLNVEIDTPERWTPNQQVIAKVIAKDAQGKPVSGNAKVTLFAVDAGVLSVSGYQVENPHAFFYGQREYQGAITDVYDQVMTPIFADSAKIRWGGDAALTRGGEKAQSEVQIVSLFSGLVAIKNGLAEIPLQLPAFDGQLNLTAVVFDQASFAKAEQTVKVASPVVIQVAMPKFMASGDISMVSLDLNNVTDKSIQGELSITVAGKLLAQESKKILLLKPNQKQTLHFSLTALQDVGIGSIKAKIVVIRDTVVNNKTVTDKIVIKQTATNNDSQVSEKAVQQTIIREWSLPIRAAQATEYYSEKALLMPAESLSLPAKVLSEFNDSSQQLQLSVALTANLDSKANWQYLIEYPYTCLEQTTSKSRPFASVLKNQSKSSNINHVDPKLAQQKIQGAIERYAELQRADGSFGLWSNNSSEQHWLTAYATEFLYDLQQKGVVVPEAMLQKATARLQSYLSSRSRHRVKTWSSNPQHYDAAYRAYAAYVLAKQNKVTLGPLRDIAEKDMSAAIGKLPGIHLGLAMLTAGSEKEGSELINQALTQERGDQYLGDYGSELRDQAMAINALLSSSSVNAEIKQKTLAMLPDLASDMQQKQWLSIQERSAILLLAMTMQQQYSDYQWQGSLIVNGQVKPLQATGEYHYNIKTSAGLEASFKNSGKKPIYASFDWSGVKKVADYNIDHGIKVATEHFLVRENNAIKLSENSRLQSGQLLLSRITLRSEIRVPDALLVNLIPAGLELENQNLNHSLKLAAIIIEGEHVEVSANIQHQEYRDDRYIAAVDLQAQQIQTLYVLSRAVTPGQYVFPAVRVESMYKPSVYGVGGSIKQINVNEKP